MNKKGGNLNYNLIKTSKKKKGNENENMALPFTNHVHLLILEVRPLHPITTQLQLCIRGCIFPHPTCAQSLLRRQHNMASLLYKPSRESLCTNKIFEDTGAKEIG